MLKSKKVIIDMTTIAKLIDMFPDMTVSDAVEYVRVAKMVKEALGLDIIGITCEDGVTCEGENYEKV